MNGELKEKKPKILDKLGFTSKLWFKSMDQFSEHTYSHIGSDDQLKAICKRTEISWLAGSKSCREIYLN